MWLGEATVNTLRPRVGTVSAREGLARMRRAVPHVAWRALARAALLAPRWPGWPGEAATEQCHAGGALRPMLLMRLRARARGAKHELLLRAVITHFGRAIAVLAMMLVGLLALGSRPTLDAPVVAAPASEGASFAVAPTAPHEDLWAVIPASVSVEPEGSIVALRIVEPEPIPVTLGELYQALARSPWPRDLWPQVVRIAQCEARYGTGVDVAAEGDGGRALGVLQIRVDAHRELARDFNLLTIDGALGAAWVVFQRSGRSFAPWSCA